MTFRRSRPSGILFSRILYIDRDDFMEGLLKKFFRLAPGGEVRLRYAHLVTGTDVVKSEAGEVVEHRCTYDSEPRGGTRPDGRQVKTVNRTASLKDTWARIQVRGGGH